MVDGLCETIFSVMQCVMRRYDVGEDSNDIMKELQVMDGIQSEEVCGHNDYRLTSGDTASK